MSFFCFFGIKSDRITVRKLVSILDGTWNTSLWLLIYLLKVHLEFFLTENLIQQNFLLYNKQKKIDNAHFSKNFLDCKKAFIERREVEQLKVSCYLISLYENTVYCFLIVNQWVCSEPVSMWAPLWNNQTMSRAIFTTAMLVISINLIATLGSVGCYILLLPVYKVEMRAKSNFLDRQVMMLGSRRHPPDAGKLALLIYIQIWSEKLKTNKFSAQTVSN